MSESTPKGFIGLFLDPQGRVQCEASCFDQGSSGPFATDKARQTHCCEQRLCQAFAEHWLYAFKDCVSIYDIEKIMKSANRIGWQIKLIPIGYEEEESEQD